MSATISGTPRCARVVGLVGLLLVGVVGCGGGASLLPVSGVVSVDAKPLAKGSLTFRPDTSKGNSTNLEATGTIENGKYTLYTNGKPGAAAGWYKVTVAVEQEVDSTKPIVPKSPLAAVFSDPLKTPLSIEVVTNPKPNAYDLLLSK